MCVCAHVRACVHVCVRECVRACACVCMTMEKEKMIQMGIWENEMGKWTLSDGWVVLPKSVAMRVLWRFHVTLGYSGLSGSVCQ